jgi:hypothetical protein
MACQFLSEMGNLEGGDYSGFVHESVQGKQQCRSVTRKAYRHVFSLAWSKYPQFLKCRLQVRIFNPFGLVRNALVVQVQAC